MLIGFEDKLAKAICTFGYCEGPDKEVKIFKVLQKVKLLIVEDLLILDGIRFSNLMDLNKLMLKWIKR